MEGTESSTTLVCDAGPIIHLAELDALDLLADFHPVLVSPTDPYLLTLVDLFLRRTQLLFLDRIQLLRAKLACVCALHADRLFTKMPVTGVCFGCGGSVLTSFTC